MGLGKTREKVEGSVAAFSDPALEQVREQARAAQLARRKTFVARLPLPAVDDGAGDVPFWSAAIHQVEQHGWKLDGWSVCPEPGPVAYAVFRAG